MLKVSLDVVPTLNAALIPLSSNKEAIQRLLVDGKIGLVSPNQRLATKSDRGLSSDDLSLVAFFAHEDVQLLIGSTAKYVDTISECQLKDEGYCNHNLKTRVTGEGAIRLCWHHDNMADDSHQAFSIARKNTVRHGLMAVSRQLHGEVKRITDVDLCWWAVRNEVYSLLPQSVIDRQFKREEGSKRVGVLGNVDTDARYVFEGQREQLERLAKPVLKLVIDDDPPAMYLRKPKPIRWESEKYLSFVRKLPCRVCGKTAGIAHHLIGHGEGKMGSKASDLFTIPLCNDHHQELHRDMNTWERQHGDQLWHVKETINRALVVGALG
ncbi:DUF968 domain-containing protein [Vibrio alginolyticus]|uniref:DUF968 domain-containing protein n=1 Tax=Vibrio TaxID=662 RepID=UPI001A8ECA58|nr:MULTISPECIES: DUF968 domain-containing protein [Vibrio]MBO0162589.1 DUF968 domain-containing protein [Vibrio alginolyticus]MCS0183918.1 DUF968 domain-containing protein [Vibrio alginolyticus]MDW1954915.1 DUF968 domain-containing protein [Vibrio sp. Vb0562]